MTVNGVVLNPPPGSVLTDITGVATALGVDPRLAVATAEVEDPGLDPMALGDNGTSVGLYQLHWGGELNQLGATFPQAEQAAFDPTTNAQVALTEFAAVQTANPNVTDPGQIAALAQRPADPAGYAAKVDAAYTNFDASGLPQTTPAQATTTALSIPNPFSGVENSIGHALIEGIFLAAGAGLVVMGMWRVASPHVHAAAGDAAQGAQLAGMAA